MDNRTGRANLAPRWRTPCSIPTGSPAPGGGKPPRRAPADDPLPAKVDVVVVGAGYCGLTAARALAAAGRTVAVLDAGDPGSGASTRNHGMLSGGLKLSPKTDRLVGPERALALRQTAFESFGFIKDLIAEEKLDVDYAHTGRFFGAHSRGWFDKLRAPARRPGARLRLHRLDGPA